MTSAPMASVLSRDLRDLSTTGLIQNFQSLLKEGDSQTVRFSRQELYKISWYVGALTRLNSESSRNSEQFHCFLAF